MSTLTCDKCGNTDTWRNARQDGDQQEGTCGKCGHRVTSTSKNGMTINGTVTGGMHQTVTRSWW